MTEHDRTFIETLINGVKSDIENLAKLFDKDIKSIEANQVKFREDIIDIYEKYRALVDRFNTADNKIVKLETELNNHKENHIDDKENKRDWRGYIVGVIGALLVGLIMYFVGKGGIK